MGTQQTDPTTHSSALSAPLHRILGRGAKQMFGQLTIAKAMHCVFASQRGLKQGLIVAAERLQSPTFLPLIIYRRTSLVQLLLADAEVVNDRQRLQISFVRRLAH